MEVLGFFFNKSMRDSIHGYTRQDAIFRAVELSYDPFILALGLPECYLIERIYYRRKKRIVHDEEVKPYYTRFFYEEKLKKHPLRQKEINYIVKRVTDRLQTSAK
jgi:hypothetical protein